MDTYCTEVRKLEDHFEGLEFHHVSSDNNVAATSSPSWGPSARWSRLAYSSKTYASHRSDSSATQRHRLATYRVVATSS
jgi:hypothetical protein